MADKEEKKTNDTKITEDKKIEKKTKIKKDNNPKNIWNEKHWDYYEWVEVNCICWAKFKINTTIPWPIKVETCYQCHPAYNPDKVVKQVIKWRLEQYLEKQKRMEEMKKKQK